MYRHWPTAAKAQIAEAIEELCDAGSSLTERKAALRSRAQLFHGGTSHGKKVWAKESRMYLEAHGSPPRTPKEEPRFADDIMFPWRTTP